MHKEWQVTKENAKRSVKSMRRKGIPVIPVKSVI